MKSCETCPFAKWEGYYNPVEMWCECPKATNDDRIVFSRASGWWYETPPAFCPLREGISFKVSKKVSKEEDK